MVVQSYGNFGEITRYIKLPTITLGIEEGLISSDFICFNMIGMFIQVFEFMRFDIGDPCLHLYSVGD
jgi:hypothetical protein